MIDFGKHLTQLMSDLGVTVRELSVRLDVDQRTISRWRKSKRGPVVTDIYRLADALGVPPSRLLPSRQGDVKASESDASAAALRATEAADVEATRQDQQDGKPRRHRGRS